jgi:hypothetical protein
MGSRFRIPNDPEMAKRAITMAINAMADQSNTDPMGSAPPAPTPISQLSVISSGGIHDIKITDPSPAYAGINYTAEYSQTADFQNFHTIDMGISQNHRANLGPGKFFWRASSFYHPATPSQPAYHGGATPQAVGDGAYSGPPMQERQGFTGPYRNSPTPPVRK